VAVGATHALAGWQDGGGGDATQSPTVTATSAPDATVTVANHEELGDVLVDGEGMTLSMFDSDRQGEASTCTGGCADAWPPLLAEGEPVAGEDVAAALSTVDREGGDTQVAPDGWPLFSYASDEDPGDAARQGANGVWWVLDPAGEPRRGSDDTPTEGVDPY
jgi:predicted lipoprotein with Yx(FWY)xxD motif